MDVLLFYILIGTILGLIAVVLMFLRAYIHLHTQLMTLTKQNMYLKNQDAGRAEQILSEAHDKAVIIIDEANKKAGSVLTQAQHLDDATAQSMQSQITEAGKVHTAALKEASAELLSLYKNALADIKSEDVKAATNITNDIEKITQEQLGQFKNILAKETINSEKLVEGKITKEYEAMEGDLKVYKERRLKEIDSEILQIIQAVTEVVVQKQLTTGDQEQLVYDALTKMKETNAKN